MAISVFLGNVGHTEYKSHIRKRKLTRINYMDNTITDSRESIESV